MYHDFAEYSEILFRGDNIIIGLLIQVVLTAGVFLLFCSSSFAQWASDPSVNTKLVTESHNPIDLSAVSDLNGGAFVFWQDNKFGYQSEVYFIHVEAGGRLSFGNQGKRVTSLIGPEDNPVCSSASQNSSVVVWNDFSFSNSGCLYAQRILDNGNFAWGDKGLQISNSQDAVSEYSIAVDLSGSTFISYIAKDPKLNGKYKVEVQKVKNSGTLLFNDNDKLVYKSHDRKMMTSLVPDDSGGVFVFWIEMQNGRSMLYGQHVNKTGKTTWGIDDSSPHSKPLNISYTEHNVVSYEVKKAYNNSIYAVWQSQRKSKDIYHQLLNFEGRIRWERGGKLATNLKGNQLDPQAVCTDSSIILSWTNEYERDKNIYIQRYDEKGRPLWNRTGNPVIKLSGYQFGQRMIDDGKRGVIIAWIDRRIDSLLANIYAQLINYKGKDMWDPSGVVVASGKNTLKSYLSLIPDDNNGVIAIFKNSVKTSNEICGQKIFSSGTYSPQILTLNTMLTGDSIKVSWVAVNEKGLSNYNIERAVNNGDGSVGWENVGTVHSSEKGSEVNYVYYDLPDTSGTLYYRVIQTDASDNIQSSEISSVNYYGAASGVVVGQNIPNPFSDSTIISFYLPDQETVSVEFFDEHVIKISEIDKSFPAGENQIIFYAKGLKPGVYFYRLKTDDFIDVKKMIITN